MRKKLPQYAAGIPRERLVELPCSSCKQSRLAEVSAVPWRHVPGKGPQDGEGNDVYARCLVCGKLDGQSSMWTRQAFAL